MKHLCFNRDISVTIIGDDRLRSIEKVCKVESVGHPYYHSWISAGVKKGFMFRKALDNA